VSQRFVESLKAADSESTDRELILERATVIATARGRPHEGAESHWGRPRSREQQSTIGLAVNNAREFVQAIT
jgi:hypothetical protein